MKDIPQLLIDAIIYLGMLGIGIIAIICVDKLIVYLEHRANKKK